MRLQYYSNLAQRAKGNEKIHVGQRYANSAQFAKTNFSFGNDCRNECSTYSLDFNRNPSVVPTAHTTLTTAHVQVSTEKDGATRKEQQKQKKKSLGRTNIVFGNDEERGKTAYQEFTASVPSYHRQNPSCPPPQNAQVLPSLAKARPGKSTQREDYMSYCPPLHQGMYTQRLDTLSRVKEVNTRDSVGASLSGDGHRHRQLSRSMEDYRHPMDVHRGNLHIFRSHKTQVTPYACRDSIWDSMSGEGLSVSPLTETRLNFSWPLVGGGVEKYKRGQRNITR